LYAITIGTFDGIHKGHKYILNNTLEIAKKENLKPLAIMLKYPIGKYYNGFEGLIFPSWERKKIIEDMGFEVQVINMEDVWHIEHPDYLDILLKRGMKHIICGEDFRFGRGAKGNTKYLLDKSFEKNFRVTILHDLKSDDFRVSSTKIRSLIKNGSIKEANYLLEKNWTVEGHVYEDRHVGFKLGFPTANIDIREQEDIIYPKYGVYLVKGYIEGYSSYLWGLTSAGIRPTYFEEKKVPKIETYFMDFFGNLYGKNVKIEFYDFLRPELKFTSEKDLIDAMMKDEDKARNIIQNIL